MPRELADGPHPATNQLIRYVCLTIQWDGQGME